MGFLLKNLFSTRECGGNRKKRRIKWTNEQTKLNKNKKSKLKIRCMNQSYLQEGQDPDPFDRKNVNRRTRKEHTNLVVHLIPGQRSIQSQIVNVLPIQNEVAITGASSLCLGSAHETALFLVRRNRTNFGYSSAKKQLK